MYLLDTNIVSYVAVGRSPAARERLEVVGLSETICLSAITEAEIRFGIALRPEARTRTRAIEKLFSEVRILPWGSQEASSYGELRAQLESSGKPLGGLDTLIAAHAIAIGAILVSNDRAFTRVPNLAVENWATDV